MHSPVPAYARQFNFHLKLNPNASFTFDTEHDFESAAFLVSDGVEVNNEKHGKGSLLVFEKEGKEVKLRNTNDTVADLILFGGEVYTEPIVAEGPFVMNSMLEIAEAYRDYQNGKYGAINYNNV
jgi:redox-sensitive bicupin YhaK (pirin superfamily)